MFCVVVVYYKVQAPSCLLCETWSIDCDCVWSCIPVFLAPSSLALARPSAPWHPASGSQPLIGQVLKKNTLGKGLKDSMEIYLPQ